MPWTSERNHSLTTSRSSGISRATYSPSRMVRTTSALRTVRVVRRVTPARRSSRASAARASDAAQAASPTRTAPGARGPGRAGRRATASDSGLDTRPTWLLGTAMFSQRSALVERAAAPVQDAVGLGVDRGARHGQRPAQRRSTISRARSDSPCSRRPARTSPCCGCARPRPATASPGRPPGATWSGRSWASQRASRPPKLQPTTLTGWPWRSASSSNRSSSPSTMSSVSPTLRPSPQPCAGVVELAAGGRAAGWSSRRWRRSREGRGPAVRLLRARAGATASSSHGRGVLHGHPDDLRRGQQHVRLRQRWCLDASASGRTAEVVHRAKSRTCSRFRVGTGSTSRSGVSRADVRSRHESASGPRARDRRAAVGLRGRAGRAGRAAGARVARDSPSRPSRRRQPAAEPAAAPQPSGPRTSDGGPAAARLDIPTLDISGLRVVPYRGWTDDAPGTGDPEPRRRGQPARPPRRCRPRRGRQLPGHRAPAVVHAGLRVPARPAGRAAGRGRDRAAGATSTRSGRPGVRRSGRPRSLAEQRAAVPGHPGREPTEAMITLSTCATPEDHAAGNFWSDEFDNPEHRIDKIGVLVRTTRSR